MKLKVEFPLQNSSKMQFFLKKKQLRHRQQQQQLLVSKTEMRSKELKMFLE